MSYKVGIIDYFATGEGRTIYIFCNKEDEIPSEVHEYFHKDVDWYSTDIFAVSILADTPSFKFLDGDERNAIKLLDEYAPLLRNMLKSVTDRPNFSFCQHFHINRS